MSPQPAGGLPPAIAKHKNACLAGAAALVVLLAVRNRSKSASTSGGAAAAVAPGNPQFNGSGAAMLDTQTIQSQINDLAYAVGSIGAQLVPSPAAQAGGGLAGGLPITAPIGGDSALYDGQTVVTGPNVGQSYTPPAGMPIYTGQDGAANAILAAHGTTAPESAGYVVGGEFVNVDNAYAEQHASDLALATNPYLNPDARAAALARLR